MAGYAATASVPLPGPDAQGTGDASPLVGVVGAGNMGRGIAASLSRAGFLVAQYDLDARLLADSVAQSTSITAVGGLRELCEKLPVAIVVSVAGEKAERSVFLASDGLFASAAGSSLLIDCGTVTVEFAREMHAAALSKGLRFLDAPVSGGPEGAGKGTLSIMVGGAEALFQDALPVLNGMGGYVVRMGDAGCGAAAKLVNQLLTASNALAATEGLALARAMGMDTAEKLEPLLKLLERSWGNSTMLQRTGGIVRDALGTPDVRAALAVSAAAPLRNFAKDLDFVLQAASSANLSLPATHAARQAVRNAEALGLDTADWAYVSEMHHPDAPHRLTVQDDVKAGPLSNRAAARTFTTLAELEAAVPPPWCEDERALLLRCGVLAGRKGAPLVVIDDDPTGTQTVHSVPVLAEWSIGALASALAEDIPCFYVLANTRALEPGEASSRAKEIGANLRAAALHIGLPRSALSVVSRSDSTLRGHFPCECDALTQGLGWNGAATLIAPFFFEGGRLTAFDTHYVLAADGSGKLTLAGETEFARDRAFGYKQSHLPSWIEEKSSGRIQAANVYTLSLDQIRTGGPDAVAKLLGCIPNGGTNATIVANALVPADMAVVALGCMLAERAGVFANGLLYRSAGALVAARAAIPPRPLLSTAELRLSRPVAAAAPPAVSPASSAGLIVVGSYVGKSSAQLAALQEQCPWIVSIELSVRNLAHGGAEWETEVARARREVEESLRAGSSVCVYTSRELVQDDGFGGLAIGQRVSSAITCLVSKLQVQPSFLVAKGGITSNDVAVVSLGVKRALVLGCIRPGVPVWRCGPETLAPGLAYVIFPGNVGTVDDLARVAEIMSGRRGTTS